MKFRWDKKYLHWGVTAFCVVVASILFYYLLFHAPNLKSGLSNVLGICMPIIDGLVLAYLLNPILVYVENKIIKRLYQKFGTDITSKKSKKRIRNFSIIITMIVFLFILYAFFSLVIPQIINSIQSIALQFPVYIKNLENWIEEILANNSDIEKFATQMLPKYSSELENWINNTFMPQVNVLIREVSLSVIGFAKFLWNFILGLILSVYILASKEQFAGQAKKIIYALYNENRANNFISDIRFIDRTFGGFISGKIVDSAIIGVLCFIGMQLLKLPYPVLISVIIGITNVIPFFGPYLGAIPSIFIILMVNPPQAIYFALFILLLQQFDGNVLGPKILGDSTGLSSFWVIFSITLFGGFFGILGMAVGVPIFAVIYAFLKRKIKSTLDKKGLSSDTKDYVNTKEIVDSVHIPLEKEQKPSKIKKKVSESPKKDAEDKITSQRD